MTAANTATVALAVCALIGIIVAVVNWFFKRGADEREFSVALRDATSALRELSTKIDGVIDTLHQHDIRLTRLEYQPSAFQVTTKVEAPSNDRSPTYRDAGSG